MYEKIEKLLKKHGITAYALSKDTGISTAAMTDYKKGRSKPSVDTLKKIADYFGVTVDYFL
jgi:toxin-antitoxin system, antitoxin component, xre family (fragment)